MSEEQLIKLLEKPLPISVNELCTEGFDFIIPSYQRGYRWTRKEVIRLILDVLSYNQDKDGKFYCLQPLVVRHKEVNGQHIWRVIDGQQRLTTIFLLLNYLIKDEKKYSLEYERDNVLSRILSQNSEIDPDENCEVYHLCNAIKVIESYFIALPSELVEVTKRKLQNNLIRSCSFIFYVMKGDGEYDETTLNLMEHDLFNHLNSGKILLTESELIKGLFLHNVGKVRVVKEIKQISMAEELDNMERVLREDEMWYFLAGDREKPSTCIDYLYKVWYISQYGHIAENVDYPIFSSLEDIASDTLISSQWTEIKKCFLTITGWYHNPLLYNLIGYLEGRKKTKSKQTNNLFDEELLAELYCFASKQEGDTNLPTKTQFVEHVKQMCRETIPNKYEGLRFDTDKNAVFNLLFLINIAMLINNKKGVKSEDVSKSTGKGMETPIGRFPFHVFHSLNWNVEHIFPQNPKRKEDLYNQLYQLRTEYNGNLPKEVSALFKKLDDNKSNFDSLNNDAEYLLLIQKLIPEGEQVMVLQNLTLLTEHDNKGIGNKFYFDKRNKLNEYQSQGSFIPAATLNVFSKWYTKNPEGYILWGDNDQWDYLEAIKETIEKFINYCEGHE